MKSDLRATINKLGNRAAGDGQMNIQTTHKLRWTMGQQYLRWTMHSGWPILVGRILQEQEQVLGGNLIGYCYQQCWPRLDNQGGNDMHRGLCWK